MNSQEILDALGTAVLVLDEDLRLVEANAAARGLTSAIHALDDTAELRQSLRRALDHGGTHALHELSLRAPLGGEERIVDVFITAVDRAGQPRNLLVEMNDATQRRRLNRDAVLLTQLGGSRLMTRQLAHEIKNPLSGLRGAAQLLARQLNDTGLREYTQVIINEADRLAALMDSMLGPSAPPRQEPVNLHELCEHIFHLLTSEAPAGVRIERDYDPSLPESPLDRNMMIQAMLNLGRNALQAVTANPGGVGRIVLRTRALANHTIGGVRHRLVSSIQFEDDGPGVPPDIRDTLFYPLVTGRDGGTGLGLALAQELVTRHGGLIEFESDPGRTLFTLLLPSSQGEGGA